MSDYDRRVREGEILCNQLDEVMAVNERLSAEVEKIKGEKDQLRSQVVELRHKLAEYDQVFQLATRATAMLSTIAATPLGTKNDEYFIEMAREIIRGPETVK
jgi:uncharacterized coiled-coil DUF342 family protein